MPSEIRFRGAAVPRREGVNYTNPVFPRNGIWQEGGFYLFVPDEKHTWEALYASRGEGAAWSETMRRATLGIPIYVEAVGGDNMAARGIGTCTWNRGKTRWKKCSTIWKERYEVGDLVSFDKQGRYYGGIVKAVNTTTYKIGYISASYTELYYENIDKRKVVGGLIPDDNFVGTTTNEDQYLHCCHCSRLIQRGSDHYFIAGESPRMYVHHSCIDAESATTCRACNGLKPKDGERFCARCAATRYECACCGKTKNSDEEPAFEYQDHEGRKRKACRYCYARARHLDVPDHGYKPQLNFFASSGDVTLGLELEMDTDDGRQRDTIVPYLMEQSMAKGKQRFFIKSDGSLNMGLEWVWHPHSLPALYAQKDWIREMLTVLRRAGMRSHDTKTCGLHIHVGRESLGANPTFRQLVAEKLVFITERYFTEMIRFSRRNKHSLMTWSGPYAGRQITMQEAWNVTRDCGERRKGVNLTNGPTIEFRFFRGTLVWKTIFATLQLVHNMVELAKDITLPVESVTWDMIINLHDNEILKKYWESRKDAKIVDGPDGEPAYCEESPDKE